MNGKSKDKILKLAISLHSNPGIYALLLGSGISRDARIPTGWEIVLDLIRKVAAVKGESPEPDPEEWYKKRFGEAPDYSKLLEKLSSTPSERVALLRQYFEPTEEEREEGLKIPTQAHKAMVTLVKYGFIKMILTTNFDRLMEKALEEQGITPDVISTDDALKGVMPYVHSKCTLIKLHGDYADTHIKNTSDELSQYSDELNALLDRIFEEFGLIVCGWSAEWDIALRNAILRCKNRRFPTYWLAKGKITDEAQRIIQHRRAEIILIDNADQFFTEFLENVESLMEFEKPHPLSGPLAIATVKRYLAEEKHYIRLHDLVTEEVERVYDELTSDRFKVEGVGINKEFFQQRMREYEELIEILMGMLTTLAYFDRGNNAYLLTKAIERIVQSKSLSGSTILIDLQHYPALLLTYATGISALVKENYDHLAAILLKPEYRDVGKKNPSIKVLNVPHVFRYSNKLVPRPNAEREYTPANNHFFDVLREPLRSYLPEDEKYEEFFDVFEYLLGLVHVNTEKDVDKKLKRVVTARTEKDIGIELISAPVGRFGWRYCEEWKSSPIQQFIKEGMKQGENWGLLKAGFFDGSVERFKVCYEKYEGFVKEICEKWHW